MDIEQLLEETLDAEETGHVDRHILFASAEVAPFAKTGGLGDVAAALPKALAKRGNHVSIVTPLYSHLDPEQMHLGRRLRKLTVPRREKNQKQVEATVWEGRLAHGTRIFFIEQDEYFGHEGIYGYDHENDADSAARWSFFSRAIVEFMRQYSVPIELLHCNDWHTALTGVYRDHYYSEELGEIPHVFTIHNLGYQGQFDLDHFDETGLPQSFLDESELQHGDQFNFMKGGILHSDRLTTVSPTYAREIQTEEYGQGLEEVIESRTEDLEGILNGVDYSVWSPSNDPYIPVRYDVERLNGKRRNKAELQHEFDLAIRPAVPLLGFVGRLTDQKGLDILLPAIEDLLERIDDPREGFQIVFLGEGRDDYADRLRELAERYPRWVGAYVGFSDEIAHMFQAGCDMMVVPSRYEPCGLTQLYAMKYGTLPIAHSTGGLADTVVDVDADTPDSTGFVFDGYGAGPLQSAIERALERYSNYRKWRPLMERAMRRDFSWSAAAHKYQQMYDGLFESSDLEHAAE